MLFFDCPTSKMIYLNVFFLQVKSFPLMNSMREEWRFFSGRVLAS